MDGPEVCREYTVTGKITFGSSALLPGQTGGVDPGHPNSHEIFTLVVEKCSCTHQMMGNIIN